MATMENLIGTDLAGSSSYTDHNKNWYKPDYLLKTRDAKDTEDPNWGTFIAANPGWQANWLPNTERYPSVRFRNPTITNPTIINNYMSGNKFNNYPSQWRGVTGLQIRSLDNQEQAILISVLDALGDTAGSDKILDRFPTSSTPFAPGIPIINSTPAILNDTAATINFSPPTVAPGFGLGPIHGFKYTLYLGATGSTVASLGGIDQRDIPLAETETSIPLTGLTANTEYRIVIKATNREAGDGGVSLPLIFTTTAASGPVTPAAPAAPTGVTVSSTTATTASVTFTAGARAISHRYTVYSGLTGTTAVSAALTNQPITAGATSFTTGTLVASTPYNIRVTAVNPSGTAESTTNVPFTTLVAAPTAPSGVVVESTTATGAIVKFTGAGTNAASYTYTVYNGSIAVSTQTNRPITLNTSTTITGLNTGTTYNVKVKSVGSTGLTAESTTNVPFTTLATPPGKPTITNVEITSATAAKVTYTAPSGGVTPTSYKYILTAAGVPRAEAVVSANPIILTGLTAGTEYTISLRAFNGTSPGAADTSDPFTPATRTRFSKTNYYVMAPSGVAASVTPAGSGRTIDTLVGSLNAAGAGGAKRMYEIFCDNYVGGTGQEHLNLYTAHRINTTNVVNILKRFCIIVTVGGVLTPMYLGYTGVAGGNFIIIDRNNPSLPFQDTATSPKPFTKIQIVYIPPTVTLTSVASNLSVYSIPGTVPGTYSPCGGVTTNTVLTATQSTDRVVLDVNAPSVTLTQLNTYDTIDNNYINNIFKVTSATYPRFKAPLGGEVTPLYGGGNKKAPHKKAPHIKTRNNRSNFKNTRKNK